VRGRKAGTSFLGKKGSEEMTIFVLFAGRNRYFSCPMEERLQAGSQTG
jgi:hypothetical protein